MPGSPIAENIPPAASPAPIVPYSAHSLENHISHAPVDRKREIGIAKYVVSIRTFSRVRKSQSLMKAITMEILASTCTSLLLLAALQRRHSIISHSRSSFLESSSLVVCWFGKIKFLQPFEIDSCRIQNILSQSATIMLFLYCCYFLPLLTLAFRGFS